MNRLLLVILCNFSIAKAFLLKYIKEVLNMTELSSPSLTIDYGLKRLVFDELLQ